MSSYLGLSVGATNPSPGVLDFDDWRSLQAIYEAAKLAGIFVVLRPGKPISSVRAQRPFELTPDTRTLRECHFSPRLNRAEPGDPVRSMARLLPGASRTGLPAKSPGQCEQTRQTGRPRTSRISTASSRRARNIKSPRADLSSVRLFQPIYGAREPSLDLPRPSCADWCVFV